MVAEIRPVPHYGLFSNDLFSYDILYMTSFHMISSHDIFSHHIFSHNIRLFASKIDVFRSAVLWMFGSVMVTFPLDTWLFSSEIGFFAHDIGSFHQRCVFHSVEVTL